MITKRQVDAIKRELPEGCVVAHLEGVNYLIFGVDAAVAAPIIGTYIWCVNDTIACRFRADELHSALAKLVRNHKRVALTEAVEENGVGDVYRREVVKIITPGTWVDGEESK